MFQTSFLKISVLFLSLVGIHSQALNTPQSELELTSTLELTQEICENVANLSQLKYEKIFDKSLQTPEIKKAVLGTLEKIKSEEHFCVRREKTLETYPLAGTNLFTFFGKSESQYIFRIKLSDNQNRIAGILYLGKLLPKDQWRIEERTVRMRDGAELKTQIFNLRDKNQKTATILTRTPYFKLRNEYNFGQISTANYYLSRGHSFVLQSIRGTNKSEGSIRLFNPKEIEDGFDTVAWIRKQNWSNGKIAAVGKTKWS